LAPTSLLVLAAALLAAEGRAQTPATAPAHTAAVARAQLPAPTLTRELALETFDSAWTRVRDTHYDSLMHGVDWNGARAELRPRAAEARTRAELRVVLAELLDRLGESHYGVIPGETAQALADGPAALGEVPAAPGDVGIEVRMLDDRFVVSRLDPGSPAARAGVKTGWAIERVAGRAMDSLLTAVRASLGDGRSKSVAARGANLRITMRVQNLLEGPAGSKVWLSLRDTNGGRVALELARRPIPGQPVQFGNLPTLLATFEHERLEQGTGCVGVIRFNYWMPPILPAFDRAMDELRGCRGIVVDLRGNFGGVAAMVMGVSGHFLDDTVLLGVMRTRRGQLRFVANPRRVSASGQPVTPYAGPLAILIDGHSASTSEFFAAGLQAAHRARLFGEVSAGEALPALMVKLPDGDMLMHVVADFTLGGGRRLEGAGAIPDERVPLDRTDLLAGRDLPLERALQWIARGEKP
jgi:carboxyl-terminal processing protease